MEICGNGDYFEEAVIKIVLNSLTTVGPGLKARRSCERVIYKILRSPDPAVLCSK